MAHFVPFFLFLSLFFLHRDKCIYYVHRRLIILNSDSIRYINNKYRLNNIKNYLHVTMRNEIAVLSFAVSSLL